MLFILHTVPVACSAYPKLIRDSVLLLPETLNIQVVTRESESGKISRARERWLGILCHRYEELVWLHVPDRPSSQSDSLWALQNG